MWEIWVNYLLPKALKTCPTSNKSPIWSQWTTYSSSVKSLGDMQYGQQKFLRQLESTSSYFSQFVNEFTRQLICPGMNKHNLASGKSSKWGKFGLKYAIKIYVHV